MGTKALFGVVIVCILAVGGIVWNKQTMLHNDIIITGPTSDHFSQMYHNFLLYGSEFWGTYWADENLGLSGYMAERDINHYAWDSIYKTVSWKEYPNYSDDATLITGADYDSFTPLLAGYARDINHLYYRGKQLLYDVSLHPKFMGSFVVDDLHVYYVVNIGESYQIITGANPQAFHNKALSDGMGTSYYADDTSIYLDFGGQALTGVDYDSFEVLGVSFAKDKNNVYRNNMIISGADTNIFTTFGPMSPYAKDKTNVYFTTKIVTGADLATFEILDGGSARDVNHTYKNEMIVK